MSRLLLLQNRLKVRARFDRLADHQARVFEAIISRWRYPETLNLCGAAGAGKTFLGWALAYERDAAFFPAPELLTAAMLSPGQAVIIDNVDTEVRPLRRLLAALQLVGSQHVLLISRQPNSGLLPVITLPQPDAGDITVVLHNLSELEHYALSIPQTADIWAVIHATL